jgi:hypothetical protein
MPCIKYTEVSTSDMSFGACRVCVCLLIASVANASARTLSCADHGYSPNCFGLVFMTIDLSNLHWDAAFQIFDCSDDIILGLEWVIVDATVVSQIVLWRLRRLSLSVWNSALHLSWTGMLKNRMKWPMRHAPAILLYLSFLPLPVNDGRSSPCLHYWLMMLHRLVAAGSLFCASQPPFQFACNLSELETTPFSFCPTLVAVLYHSRVGYFSATCSIKLTASMPPPRPAASSSTIAQHIPTLSFNTTPAA